MTEFFITAAVLTGLVVASIAIKQVVRHSQG